MEPNVLQQVTDLVRRSRKTDNPLDFSLWSVMRPSVSNFYEDFGPYGAAIFKAGGRDIPRAANRCHYGFTPEEALQKALDAFRKAQEG